MDQNYTIDLEQLNEGEIILVRGNIESSHLLTLVEGERLDAENKMRVSRGLNPIDKPFTAVSIRNAQIIPLNSMTLTTEEKFVQEHFLYTNDDRSPICGIINKSTFPNLFYQTADISNPAEETEFIPEAELEKGLDVILVLYVLGTKNSADKGIGLQAVIVEEPKYQEQTSWKQKLADVGIILMDKPEHNPE